MRRYLHCTLIICTLVAFSACHSIPDHARYIPKDALLVVGLNTKSLGKKVAWQAIMGSKLFKEMQDRMADKQVMDNLEKSGIDGMNTFYVYVKSDKRFKYGSKITALLPLSDVKLWEAYIKKSFPGVTVKQLANRKEANLNAGMYVGWTDKLLIVMNLQPGANTTTIDSSTTVAQPIAIDDAMLAAEMETAFTVSKDNALTGNAHFTRLEKDNHDVVFWMNYDELMSQYMSQNVANMTGGMSLTNDLWKGAAFAGGFDFENGSIKGDMRYYASDALKDLGSENADKEMIEKLPAANLDMLMAWHVSPKGIRSVLEKTGALGLANLALSSQNLNVDYILDAFTGDMAMTLNDLEVKKQEATTTTLTADTGTHITVSNSYTPSFSAVYVMKINKEENFKKLITLFTQNGLVSLGNNTYAMPRSATDSVIIMIEGKYVVVSNTRASVDAYLHGDHKDKLPAAANAYGHPFAMYIDVQQMVKMIDPALFQSTHDSTIIADGKKLLTDMYLNGGEYKDDAFHYSMGINFGNKDENSLLQLMDFAMKLNDVKKERAASGNNSQAMAN